MGFSGADCEVREIDKFIGEWDGVQLCDKDGIISETSFVGNSKIWFTTSTQAKFVIDGGFVECMISGGNNQLLIPIKNEFVTDDNPPSTIPFNSMEIEYSNDKLAFYFDTGSDFNLGICTSLLERQ